MKQCPHCSRELMAGFDFCHHCGASISGPLVADKPKKNAVEVVDELKRRAAMSLAMGQSASVTVSRWLGQTTSPQRIILYALLTGAAFTLLFPSSTSLAGIVGWLERWLLSSLIFLAPISYWITGYFPFAGASNAVIGDYLSLRRRILVALLWTIPLSGIVLFFFRASDEAALGQMLGVFLLSFYLMGFASYWRPIYEIASSMFQDKMASDTQRVAHEIRSRLEARKIHGLELAALDMAQLRRLTGGEVSALQGQQLVFTRGRARIIVFVQDFGDGLFIRWSGFYDASGRRLWVLMGQIVQFWNDLAFRWTGTNLTKSLRAAQSALSPASNRSSFTASVQGGRVAKLLGLVEGISEYGWNDLYALHGAVRETVVSTLRRAEDAHEEKDKLRAMLSHSSSLEQAALGQRSSRAQA